MQISEIFKKNLVDCMRRKNLSNSDLARMMQTTPSTVSRWLKGSVPHPRTAEKLQKVLSAQLLPVIEPFSKPSLPISDTAMDDLTFEAALRAIEFPKLCGAMIGVLTMLKDGNVPLSLERFSNLQLALNELRRRIPVTDDGPLENSVHKTAQIS